MRFPPAGFVAVAGLIVLGLAIAAAPRPVVAAGAADIPSWLRPYVGEGEGQIAPVVLERARALYFRKVAEGVVKNPCYFAMDATRPAELSDGRLGRRFYTICEAEQSFRATSSGHGSGRNLKGAADFANGRQCARNFGNALNSLLTTGGGYVTAETKTSFKGYYRTASGKNATLIRSFVQFDGEGETANARDRAIGGHAAQVLKSVCLRKSPDSPYANADGFVLQGTLVDYTAGRSNGCTSWSAADAGRIVPLVQDRPTTVYIYPESRDIDAVAKALKAGLAPSRAGLYWNAACLKEIGAPVFWSRAKLEPVIARWEASQPKTPPRPIPLCQGE